MMARCKTGKVLADGWNCVLSRLERVIHAARRRPGIGGPGIYMIGGTIDESDPGRRPDRSHSAHRKEVPA